MRDLYCLNIRIQQRDVDRYEPRRKQDFETLILQVSPQDTQIFKCCFDFQRQTGTAVSQCCGLPFGLDFSSTLTIRCGLGGGAPSQTVNHSLRRPSPWLVHHKHNRPAHDPSHTPSLTSLRITATEDFYSSAAVCKNLINKSRVVKSCSALILWRETE